MKRCVTCKDKKQADKFHKDKSQEDRLSRRCAECTNAYHRKRYKESSKEHKERRKAYNREWTKNKWKTSKEWRDKCAERRRREFKKATQEAIEHYGGKCVMCGYDNPISLTLDHIDNDGAKHRRIGYRSLSIWARQNDYPKSLQLLCRNCNWIKYCAYNGLVGSEEHHPPSPHIDNVPATKKEGSHGWTLKGG